MLVNVLRAKLSDAETMNNQLHADLERLQTVDKSDTEKWVFSNFIQDK
jgi:hypothetical protein